MLTELWYVYLNGTCLILYKATAFTMRMSTKESAHCMTRLGGTSQCQFCKHNTFDKYLENCPKQAKSKAKVYKYFCIVKKTVQSVM